MSPRLLYASVLMMLLWPQVTQASIPSSINLNNWRLQIPKKNSAGSIISITSDQFYSGTAFTNPIYQPFVALGPNNQSLVLTAPVQGDTTPTSNCTRTEFRNEPRQGDWGLNDTSGIHEMNVTLAVKHHTVGYNRTCIAQIHGKKFVPLFMFWEGGLVTTRLKLDNNSEWITCKNSNAVYNLGDKINIRIRVVNRLITVQVGEKDYSSCQMAFNSDFWTQDCCYYFKTGDYNQKKRFQEPIVEGDKSQVEIFSLQTFHSYAAVTPAPTRAVTAAPTTPTPTKSPVPAPAPLSQCRIPVSINVTSWSLQIPFLANGRLVTLSSQEVQNGSAFTRYPEFINCTSNGSGLLLKSPIDGPLASGAKATRNEFRERPSKGDWKLTSTGGIHELNLTLAVNISPVGPQNRTILAQVRGRNTTAIWIFWQDGLIAVRFYTTNSSVFSTCKSSSKLYKSREKFNLKIKVVNTAASVIVGNNDRVCSYTYGSFWQTDSYYFKVGSINQKKPTDLPIVSGDQSEVEIFEMKSFHKY